jgi:prolyl oligopeptidase
LWLEQGGVYVIANIRGGGEFGPKWHQAGLKTKRQLVFDDFIAVAEDLIAKKITSPKHLGIEGGSNGGLLVGVMFTQRPDLFNAVICAVPLLDMLRFHTLLAGASWMGEYGNPEDETEGAFLRSISPYHNVNADTDYPEILFVTSTKDDRVHPGHARKMAARLEDMGYDFLYYENIDGGHSAAANLKERARQQALQHVYLLQKLSRPA